MATVELAASMPVLMFLVLAGLYGVRVADAHARCADAAREVARAAARGDARAVELGRQAIGRAAVIAVQIGTDTVTATVSLTVRPYGVDLVHITVSERAIAAREPVGGVEAGASFEHAVSPAGRLVALRGPARRVARSTSLP